MSNVIQFPRQYTRPSQGPSAKELSFPPVIWWQACLNEGGQLAPRDWQEWVSSADLKADFYRYLRGTGILNPGPWAGWSFLWGPEEFGVRLARRNHVRGYRFPELAAARLQFEAVVGRAIAWTPIEALRH